MNSVKAIAQLEELKKDRLCFVHNNELDEVFLNDIKAINLAIVALEKNPNIKDNSFNCRACGKELKTWKSIQRGFGPVCEKKYLANIYKNQQISFDSYKRRVKIMAVYRTVHCSFWEDTKVQDDMTPEDRYFMLYLLTNTHSNQVGAFEISKRQISNEIGYDIQTIDRLLYKFENELKVIKYDNETKELLIVNWYKYNWTSSIKVKKCIESEMKNIKSKEILDYLNTVCIPYKYPMDTETDKVREKEKEKQKEKEKEKQKQKQNVESDSCVDGSEVNDSCIDGLQATIDFYNNNIGLITPYGLEILEDYVKEMGKDVVIYAMQISVEANKRTIQYIKGILNNWSKKGIKTLTEAKNENNYNKKNTTNTDWGNMYDEILKGESGNAN